MFKPSHMPSRNYAFGEKHFGVMRTICAADIVSVEGDGGETKGRQPVSKNCENCISDSTFFGEAGATWIGSSIGSDP